MVNYILLFVCLLSGILFKRAEIMPKNMAMGLNKLLIYFFIPILTLLYLPEIKLNTTHLWLVLTPWIVYIFSFLFFQTIHKINPIARDARAALIMTSGIGSISFVGFPIFELFYGEEGLSYGIILSLAGTFMVCNSIGVFTGFWFKHKAQNFAKVAKGVLFFPPFIAMLFSLILMLFDYQHNTITEEVLSKLSSPFSILALFTIGLQIDTKGFKTNRNHFFLGQLFKLLLAPLLIFLLFFALQMQKTLIAKICILGAGIGSMNTIAIVAAELKLKPKLALLMPGLGIPISIFTVILIHYLID